MEMYETVMPYRAGRGEEGGGNEGRRRRRRRRRRRHWIS